MYFINFSGRGDMPRDYEILEEAKEILAKAKEKVEKMILGEVDS